MTIRYLSAATLAATLIVPTLASAEWKGEAELGYVKTGGNTDTSSLNAKAKAEQEVEKWRNTINLGALNNDTDGVTTAERYFITGQTNYKFTKRSYIFGLAGYETDKFSGYDYRASASVGYGNRVVDNKAVTLDLEIAPGWRQSQIEATDATPSVTENEFIVLGKLNLLWNITDNTKLTEELSTAVGDSEKGGTVTRSLTALESQVAGNLFTKISYDIRHASVVPAGKEKTDDIFSVALLYKFGQ